MSSERETETGRTTYFGENPEAAVEVAKGMRKGLFGEKSAKKTMTRYHSAEQKKPLRFMDSFLKKAGK